MTRIPSDLARFGLKVELVPGWETRGSSAFAPAAVTCHWTAGPRGTKGRPSLGVVINGRPGLDGPLCNVYLARDGVCVVVAAGRANHAGAGGFRGLVGNSAVYGIEAESGGDGDWTPEMLEAYPRLVAALLWGLNRDGSWCHGHNEWAPTRKIDIRDIIASVRNRTVQILANPGTPVQEDDMPLSQQELNFISDAVANRGIGKFGAIWQTLNAAADRADAAAKGVTTLSAAITALTKLVAEQNGLTVDDVRRVVSEEIAKGVDVDVTVAPGTA